MLKTHERSKQDKQAPLHSLITHTYWYSTFNTPTKRTPSISLPSFTFIHFLNLVVFRSLLWQWFWITLVIGGRIDHHDYPIRRSDVVVSFSVVCCPCLYWLCFDVVLVIITISPWITTLNWMGSNFQVPLLVRIKTKRISCWYHSLNSNKYILTV